MHDTVLWRPISQDDSRIIWSLEPTALVPTALVRCACGHIISVRFAPVVCDCGRVYRAMARLEVWEER